MAPPIAQMLPQLMLLALSQARVQCPSERSSSLQFTVRSELNGTGHRSVSVQMHGESAQVNTVEVSVDHWTARCRGMEVVGFKANANGPTSSGVVVATADAPAGRKFTYLNSRTTTAVPEFSKDEYKTTEGYQRGREWWETGRKTFPDDEYYTTERYHRRREWWNSEDTTRLQDVEHTTGTSPTTENYSWRAEPSATTVEWKIFESESTTVEGSASGGSNSRTAVDAAALPCRSDYTLVPGFGCYKKHSHSVQWREAQSECESEGAHLAIPDTEQELTAIKGLGIPIGSVYPWMGISKVNGSWTTVEGDAALLAWGPGEPTGDSNCVFLHDDGLHDLSCTITGAFICEQRQM